MARYEVAVDTPIRFSPHVRAEPFAIAEQTVTLFDGYRFVWHANNAERDNNEPCLPTVTVVVRNQDNYLEEIVATNRFISAVSYALNYPMSIQTTVATGFKAEFDRPALRQPSPSLGTMIVSPPSEIIVAKDARLRLVVALYREARFTASPFYGFLAYFNALDAAFDNDEPARDSFIRTSLDTTAVKAWQEASPPDWPNYLRDNLRNAVAHAVRRPGKPVLDPDELTDRNQLGRASILVSDLVRRRVLERWPTGVSVSNG